MRYITLIGQAYQVCRKLSRMPQRACGGRQLEAREPDNFCLRAVKKAYRVVRFPKSAFFCF